LNNTAWLSPFRLHQLEAVSEWACHVDALVAGQQVIIDHFQTGRTETLDQGPEIPDEQCRMRLASQTKLTVGYV